MDKIYSTLKQIEGNGGQNMICKMRVPYFQGAGVYKFASKEPREEITVEVNKDGLFDTDVDFAKFPLGIFATASQKDP
jgi:hypothetical protein